MNSRFRKGFIVALSLLGLGTAFLFTPPLLHHVLRAATSPAQIKSHQAEWARLAELRPQVLNSSDPEAFHRYSKEAFRWFRVRGMIDQTCEDTSPGREWYELIVYFTRSGHVERPPELAGTP
jgi:hypothetical protein